jgi:hypothetical protein
MANDRRDGTPKVRVGGGGGGSSSGRGRRWDDAAWPGEDGSVIDAFPAAFSAGDGSDEGTVLVVEANRPSAWERMLEALESGELPVQAGPGAEPDENDVGLRASIAERVNAHAEWPARTRR